MTKLRAELHTANRTGIAMQQRDEKSPRHGPKQARHLCKRVEGVLHKLHRQSLLLSASLERTSRGLVRRKHLLVHP